MPEAGRDECAGKKIVKTEERKLNQADFESLTRLVITFKALITAILNHQVSLTIFTIWSFQHFMIVVIIDS